MVRVAVACVLAACSGKAEVAKDAARPRPAVPADAAPADVEVVAVAIDARVELMLACRSGPHHRTMGEVSVAVDAATLKGELVVYDTSKAPTRHFQIRAKPTPDETVFVFDGYAQGDSVFKGKPVPRADHLKPDAVVARIVRTGAEVRLVFDGAFRPSADFDQGSWTDGYSCK
jgi:hypothetical protein